MNWSQIAARHQGAQLLSSTSSGLEFCWRTRPQHSCLYEVKHPPANASVSGYLFKIRGLKSVKFPLSFLLNKKSHGCCVACQVVNASQVLPHWGQLKKRKSLSGPNVEISVVVSTSQCCRAYSYSQSRSFFWNVTGRWNPWNFWVTCFHCCRYIGEVLSTCVLFSALCMASVAVVWFLHFSQVTHGGIILAPKNMISMWDPIRSLCQAFSCTPAQQRLCQSGELGNNTDFNLNSSPLRMWHWFLIFMAAFRQKRCPVGKPKALLIYKGITLSILMFAHMETAVKKETIIQAEIW